MLYIYIYITEGATHVYIKQKAPRACRPTATSCRTYIYIKHIYIKHKAPRAIYTKQKAPRACLPTATSSTRGSSTNNSQKSAHLSIFNIIFIYMIDPWEFSSEGWWKLLFAAQTCATCAFCCAAAYSTLCRVRECVFVISWHLKSNNIHLVKTKPIYHVKKPAFLHGHLFDTK